MSCSKSQQIDRIKGMLNKFNENEVDYVKEFESKPLVSKQDILEKTGFQIQDELRKKYSELQKELNEINKTSNETEQIFECLERMYVIEYSMKCADEININNCHVVMNEITEKMNEYGYEETEELKIETRQTQNEKVQEEVESIVEKKEALNRHINRVINKTKWEIDKKMMMIIGRYFKTNSDFINIMKVNKKYHKLVNLYSFNPISECSLFKHIVIQHFYKNNDKNERVKDMEYYIYWYNDKEAEKQPQVNEIFKYSIRQENNKGKKMRHSIEVGNEYIDDNIDMLEEWSGLEVGEVLYDSERDGKQSKTFRDKILHHKQMYFIIIDSDGNVFGHYHSTKIDKVNVDYYDRNIFMFTLNSNGRCEVRKFEQNSRVYTYIYGDEEFIFCGACLGEYYINNFDKKESQINKSIMSSLKEINENTLTGKCGKFKLKRLVVLKII